jgi:hypothetical protein
MSPVEVKKEVDIVSVDPLFIERQRNRYAGRALASVIWLNGLAAIALLVTLAARAGVPAVVSKQFADAMLVFGAGSVLGLASGFVAYIGRTLRLEYPALIEWRRPLRLGAIIVAIIGAFCFLTGVNMARHAAVTSAGTPQTQSPAAPATAP